MFFFRQKEEPRKFLVWLAFFYFPVANRKGILLSSKDFRQLAGKLFFFRRRKKNQERRHPFERVDGTREKQSPLENRLFGDGNRGTASLNAPAVAGTAPCGADSRYDRSGRQAPGLQPKITARPSHYRLLPALPCRPGETVLPQRETYSLAEKVHQADRFLFSAHFAAGSVARTPGPQGRAGRPGLERWPTGFLGLESRG